MNQEKRPVTLEDLLRLKRAERPPAEFWGQFERQLRAKQLAALVERRPWWRSFPRVFSGFTRYQLPLGATAIVALGYLALREYRPPALVPAAIAPQAVAFEPGTPAPALAEAPLPVEPSAAIERTGVVSTESSGSSVGGTAPVSATMANTAEFASEGFASSAIERTIASNLASVQASAPAVTRGLLMSAHGFETRAFAARNSSIEPLAQMTTPADARQAKFASALATSFSRETAVRGTDHTARGVPDERLYEGAVRRFDAKADRFTLKL